MLIPSPQYSKKKAKFCNLGMGRNKTAAGPRPALKYRDSAMYSGTSAFLAGRAHSLGRFFHELEKHMLGSFVPDYDISTQQYGALLQLPRTTESNSSQFSNSAPYCRDSTSGTMSFSNRIEIHVAAPVAGAQAFTYWILLQHDESSEQFGGLLQLSATSCRRTRM
jgi:hypothetical protein